MYERVGQRVVHALQRLRQPSRRAERWLLPVAFVIFVVVTIAAAFNLPDVDRELRPVGFLGVAALTVAAIVVNGLEFRFAGRLLGRRVGVMHALEVSLLSSAANVLPIPGAVLVRTHALRRVGERYSSAFGVTTAVGLAWVSAAAVFAGAFAFAVSSTVLGGLFFAGGLAGLAIVVLILRASSGNWTSLATLSQLVVLELLSVAVSGARLFAVAWAMDFGVTPMQAVVVNLGGILSSVAGIFPGGLGLRELLSAAFGRLMGVPTAEALLMAAVDRLAFYGVLAIGAVGLLLAGRWQKIQQEVAEDLEQDAVAQEAS